MRDCFPTNNDDRVHVIPNRITFSASANVITLSSPKFGADGWRAVIAEDFNFASVARGAQAKADLKV